MPPVAGVDALVRFCEDGSGDGSPEAADYTGTAPHHIAIFRNEALSATTVSSFERQSGRMQADRPSTDPEKIRLSGCVRSVGVGTEEVDTCAYGDSVDLADPGGPAVADSVPLHGQRFEATLYELRTGERIHTGELGVENCPQTVEGAPARLCAAFGYGGTMDVFAEFVNEDIGGSRGPAPGSGRWTACWERPGTRWDAGAVDTPRLQLQLRFGQ